jgi:hypothetical protein
MIKDCKNDSDCNENYFCSFNDDTLTHTCVGNDKNNLYYGCLNKDSNNFQNDKIEIIESKTDIDQKSLKNCIDFTRRQKNKDGLSHNYMIYKQKKNVFVDTTTINIYLKCGEQILSVIPYNDYFDLSCNDNQKNCLLVSKPGLKNFIVQNSQNCNSEKLKLEIIYECENEGIKKKEEIPIYLNNSQPIQINLKCPINKNDEQFEGKCSSIYYDINDINNNIDINTSMYDCNNPLFKVPRIINNEDDYKKMKYKKSQVEMKNYDDKINDTIENLKKLKAEKYIKIKKIQTGETITLDQAYNIINNKLNYFTYNSKENWRIFSNYDAAQYLFDDPDVNSAIKLYGKVYTLDEALKTATENNESYFVWYHNNYELKDYASKLFFIDIFSIDSNLFDKSNWSQHANVTTSILKIENYENGVEEEEYKYKSENKKFKELQKLNDDQVKYTNSIIKEYQKLINNTTNSNNFDYGQGIVTELNNKITKSGQVIDMNNYEIKINNQIITILQIVLIFIVGIFIVVIAYYSNFFNRTNTIK